MPVLQTNRDPRKKSKFHTATLPRDGQIHRQSPPSSLLDFSIYVENLRQAELPSLFPSGSQSPTIYLDSSGLPPVPKSLLQAQYQQLESNLFGNPHSANPSSRLAATRIEDVRNRVCKELFRVDRYPQVDSRREEAKDGERQQVREENEGWEVVFTSGATASLKLAAECFDFAPRNPSNPISSNLSCNQSSQHSSSTSSASFSSSNASTSGYFIHTLEAHTSLVGLSEVATASTSKTRNMAASDCLSSSEEEILALVESDSDRGPSLIALPLQCNASGFRSSEFLKKLLQSREKNNPNSFYVLLDAASYLSSSSRLDLSKFTYSEAPDLVAFSFAKIFGITGLGGLLVKRRIYRKGLLNRKSYYGGGTLEAQAFLNSDQGIKIWKEPSTQLANRLEDGSPNTQSIISVSSSLDVFQRLLGDWDLRRDYVKTLTKRLFIKMESLRHGNGEKVVKIYTRSKEFDQWSSQPEHEESLIQDQGPILMLNLLSSSNTSIPPSSVSRLAILSNICLRTGRLCNPGVIQNQLGSDPERIKALWKKGVSCGEGEDETDENEGPSSAVRVSLSVWNTEEDIDRFVDFIERFFVIPDIGNHSIQLAETNQGMILQSLTIYPIKSASGQKISTSWELTNSGLLFDREWCLVSLDYISQSGEMKVLSQKQHPSMARIRPVINLESNKMSVDLVLGKSQKETVEIEKSWKEKGWNWKIEIGLDEGKSKSTSLNVKVCEDKVLPTLIQRSEVRELFSRFLGINCTLARMPSASSRYSKVGVGSNETPVPILFSNESPFLLLNQESIKLVKNWIQEDQNQETQIQFTQKEGEEEEEKQEDLNLDNLASRFRGNFIIGNEESTSTSTSTSQNFFSHHSLQEDSFTKLSIGENLFGILAPCRRCEMIALDSETGIPRPETLLSLARRRRGKNGNGRCEFGLHMAWNGSMEGKNENQECWIKEGMKVRFF